MSSTGSWASSSSPAGRRPATGMPAESPWRCASVAAATCLEANAASTAAILMGDKAPKWLEDLKLPSRLVHLDHTVERIAGWPD